MPGPYRGALPRPRRRNKARPAQDAIPLHTAALRHASRASTPCSRSSFWYSTPRAIRNHDMGRFQRGYIDQGRPAELGVVGCDHHFARRRNHLQLMAYHQRVVVAEAGLGDAAYAHDQDVGGHPASICSHSGPIIMRRRGYRYPPVRVTSVRANRGTPRRWAANW